MSPGMSIFSKFTFANIVSNSVLLEFEGRKCFITACVQIYIIKHMQSNSLINNC